MKIKTMRLFMVVLVLFIMAIPSHGDDSAAIDVQLTIMKIETLSGKETLVIAQTIRPGDLLLYEIVYKIKGQDKVLELLAQLPIPVGMEYVTDSAQPPQVLGSLDGVDFLPFPVPGEGGRVGMPKEISSAKCKMLGWTKRGLSPGDEFAVSARLKVDFIP